MSAPQSRRRARKRKADDEDIIKTRPDKRRATGKADENDFDEDDDEAKEVERPTFYSHERGWSSVHGILEKKHALRKIHSRGEKTAFPFLELPAEVRNMIYRYLVVSQAQTYESSAIPGKPFAKEPVNVGSSSSLWRSGGIETAILSVNRQVRSNR